MGDWRLWVILTVTVGSLVYAVISNYAIRGNDLKHLATAIKCLEEKLLKRIERLENKLFK